MSKIDFIVSVHSPVLQDPGSEAFFLCPSMHYNFKYDNCLSSYQKVFVAKYPNRSPSQTLEYDKEIDRRVARYLEVIGPRLNKIHDKQYDLEFWEKVISIPFSRYVKMTLDFYNACTDNFDPLIHRAYISNLVKPKIPATFSEQRDYLQHDMLSDEVLFQIFCKVGGFSEVEGVSFSPPSPQKERKFRSLLKRIVTRQAKLSGLKNRILLRLTQFFFAKNPVEVGLVGTLFKPSETRRLIRNSSGAINYLYHDLPSFDFSNHTIDKRMRNYIAQPPREADAFDMFFFASLPIFFPIAFLEAYDNVESKLIEWKKAFPKMKFAVSEVWPSDCLNSLLLALLKAKNGVRHIYNEHNYLEHYHIGSLIHKSAALCDKFASLGWRDETIPNLVPCGSLYDLGDETSNDIEHDILFVSGAFLAKAPQVSTSYGFAGEAGLKSIEMTRGFLNALSLETRSKIYFKAYPASRVRGNRQFKIKIDAEFGYNCLKVFDDGDTDATHLMKRSGVVVTNYLSTSHIQSLMMNKPTLILKPRGTYELNNYYSDFYRLLLEAKIMHEDFQSAAEHLEAISEDPNKWWSKENVRSARDSFLRENFGRGDALQTYLISLLQDKGRIR